MHSVALLALSALPLLQAQNVPPPSPVRLTTSKSAVLPVLPTGFTGVDTLEGAIISKAPMNYTYTPVAGPAQVQSNLPAATYVATLPAVPFDGLTGTVIRGTVTGSSKQGDTGVTFSFNLTGFPNLTQYGTFAYHIHDSPVPSDGNCTSTLAHFDYTNAGEYYACANNQTQNCQTGDLAGKHGRINGTSYNVTYTELYVSTDPSSPYYFGNKSIVFHTVNTTRLTCANFTMLQARTNSTTAGGGAAASGSTVPAATRSGSDKITAFGSAMVGGAVFLGVFFLL